LIAAPAAAAATLARTASGSGNGFSMASSLIMPAAFATAYAVSARNSGRTVAAM
jgi:hypothetical protein